MNLRRFSTRRAVSIAGGVVTLGCIAFFLKALFDAFSGLDAHPLTLQAILAVAVLCFCYACALFLLAKSWQLLLRAAAPRHAPESRLVDIYALTQFAKYLPGNVFHLAGRHAILTREGFPQRALLVSTFQENLLLVLAALLVGSAFVVVFPAPFVMSWLHHAGASPILFSTFARTALACALVGVSTVAIRETFRRLGIQVHRSLALDCLFFALQGLSFFALLYAISGEIRPQALGIVALSWTAGFVVPGAPGGVGGREVVMLFLLKGSVGLDEVVMTAALYRITTFGGDLLFFGYGLMRIGFRFRPSKLAYSSKITVSKGQSATGR